MEQISKECMSANQHERNGEYEKAFEMYKTCAEKGESYAQNAIGYFYHYGIGVGINSTIAISFYRMAIEQKYYSSFNNLANLYQYQTKDPDHKEIIRLYEVASQNGIAAANTNLGLLYQHGNCGLSKDIKEAIRYYQLTIAAGSEKAHVYLRECQPRIYIPQKTSNRWKLVQM